MHDHWLQRVSGLLAIALLALTSIGCQGTTKQGTLYNVTISSELVTFLPGDLETVHKRALAVVTDEFHYEVIDSKLDAHEGIINGKTAKGGAVRVETFKHSDKVTKVEVYVGGDQAIAQDLLSSIEAKLS